MSIEMFCDIFMGNTCGSVRMCECGRTFFDDSREWDWEEGELESLREQSHKSSPTVFDNCGPCRAYVVGGVEYVEGCPCGYVDKLAKVIIKEAPRVAEFLNQLSDKHADYAKTLRVEGGAE